MDEFENESQLSMFQKEIPFIMEGIVMDTSDPDQMGRVKIWVPAIDGEYYDVPSLPWCEYASPFAGFVSNFPAGREGLQSRGPVAYGFWSIPKIGSQALVFFLNGDANRRFYFGSYYGLHGNRSLPDGRNLNRIKTPPEGGRFTDTFQPLRPELDNLVQQFIGNLSAPQAISRGAYERQVAQDLTEKDGKDGYSLNVADDTDFDNQCFSWTTPGHHAILLSDHPDWCRVRVKTCAGNQVILDDTNERIYISTARGGAWLEFDEDGHIHFFANESFSVQAGKDINLTAGRNINIEAGTNINIKAVGGTLSAASKGTMTLESSKANLHLVGCLQLHAIGKTGTYVNGESIHMTSSTGTYLTNRSFDLKSSGVAKLEGRPVIVNAGGAATATEAICGNSPASPPIVPAHEPWVRPKSTIKRNKFWRE